MGCDGLGTPAANSLSGANVSHAAAKHLLLGKLLHKGDLPRNENGLPAWSVRHRYLNKGFLVVRIAALESQAAARHVFATRSEEHTSELQSQSNLVCRLL